MGAFVLFGEEAPRCGAIESSALSRPSCVQLCAEARSCAAAQITDPDINAIEADIIFSLTDKVPIMAHPPAKSSDLDFELFLGRCLAHGSSGASVCLAPPLSSRHR